MAVNSSLDLQFGGSVITHKINLAVISLLDAQQFLLSWLACSKLERHGGLGSTNIPHPCKSDKLTVRKTNPRGCRGVVRS